MKFSSNMRGFQFEKAGFVVLIIFLMSFGIEMLFHKLKLNVDKNLNNNIKRIKYEQNENV